MTQDLRADLAALAPRLRRFAYALSGDPEQADDLVQTAYLKALTTAHQFEPGTRLDSWMFRIVQNCFLDETRRRKTRGQSVELDPDRAHSDGGVGSRSPEARLDLERVRAAMRALPEDQRAVLALVAIEGFSYKQAAEALQTPIGTVMSRLARARARLQRQFEGATA